MDLDHLNEIMDHNHHNEIVSMPPFILTKFHKWYLWFLNFLRSSFVRKINCINFPFGQNFVYEGILDISYKSFRNNKVTEGFSYKQK